MNKQLFIRICKDYNIYGQMLHLISIPNFKLDNINDKQLISIIAFIKFLNIEGIFNEYLSETLSYCKKITKINDSPICLTPVLFLSGAFFWPTTKYGQLKWQKLNQKWTIIYNNLKLKIKYDRTN